MEQLVWMSYETGSYQKVYYDFIYFLYSLNYVLSFPNSYPKVKEHLQGAVRENIFLFTSIDTDPRNGQASWKEYHAWFLKKNGNNDTGQSSNHDEAHPELERSIKGIINMFY